MPSAKITRGPIELTQAVEDGALDPVLGIAVKHDLLLGVVLARSVEQPENAGVNQIVEIHVNRQVFVHSDGDGLHQPKMLENDTIAQRSRNLALFRVGAAFRLEDSFHRLLSNLVE